MASNLLTDNLLEPLNGAKTARVEVSSEFGHVSIDRLSSGEQVLASGSLEYFEKNGPPAHVLSSDNGEATLTVKGGGTMQSWFKFPWSACGGGAYEWQIHLNPDVRADITAHSGGGNVRLDLAGMAVTHVAADTGGGNMEVVLPDNAANLEAVAKTGAGNVNVDVGNGTTGNNRLSADSGAGDVAVHVPGSLAVKIHATSGMGKVVVDPQFGQIDEHTYQSPDFDTAANKVEITVKSGLGNVSVDTK
jgi:hypothetical protein